MSTQAITPEELVRAAINLPADQFKLGDRTFNIVDLPYDDYLEFTTNLAPFIEKVSSSLLSKFNVPNPDLVTTPEFNTSSIIASIGHNLPKLVQIICRQTDPFITTDDIKELAKKPTALIEPVIKQIKQNDMINDLASFFAQGMEILIPKKA